MDQIFGSMGSKMFDSMGAKDITGLLKAIERGNTTGRHADMLAEELCRAYRVILASGYGTAEDHERYRAACDFLGVEWQ